jgi:hypothetical protein
VNNSDITRNSQYRSPFITMVVSKVIDIKNDSIDRIAEILNEAMGESTVSMLPKDILTAAAEDIKRQAELKVLIWGPGSSGGDLYTKRCELRKHLQKFGHEVVFSEDVCAPDTPVRSGLNLTVAEFLQAKAYDYIVCLMASPGSIGEVHDFAKIKKFARKMMICIDSCHKSGYSTQGTIRIFEGFNGKVDWFENPTDLSECHLATRVLDQIHKVTEARQWELATGGSS